MIRKLVTIDDEQCNGCGLCVQACHEGAIILKDGKAKLVRDDYCDGLGDCLPVCPMDAIRLELRDAAPYDEAAVRARMAERAPQRDPLPCGCPGSDARTMPNVLPCNDSAGVPDATSSQLGQWPVQIRLVPVNAPYFDGAHLLIAADCTAYAYANFHNQFMRKAVTLIGCPKLDDGDYAEKLSAIIQQHSLHSIRIVRMEVPCCGGLERAVQQALQRSGKTIPWGVTTITVDGNLQEA